jgi:serine/threonine protein kinase
MSLFYVPLVHSYYISNTDVVLIFLLFLLYLLFKLMDCDLHQIIQSKQPLSEMHHKCFLKQILEGIKAMHNVGIFRKFHSISGSPGPSDNV